MKKIKNYENKELEYILRYSLDNKYGEFTPIIIDIVKRLAYEYGYSNEEMIKKASNLKANLNKIEFVRSETGEIEESVLGTYLIKRKVIQFNQTFIDKIVEDAKKTLGDREAKEFLANKLYEALAHEVLHALNSRITIDGYKSGLYYICKDKEGKKVLKGEIANEIYNEAAASRLTKIGRNEEKNEPQYTYEYAGFAHFSSLTATACGVIDKKAFKAGMEGRSKFYKVLASNFDSFSKEEFEKQFIDIETSLEELYSLLLGSDGGIKEQLNQEEISETLNLTMEKIMLLLKISLDETAKKISEGNNKKTYEEYKYRIDRSTYISLRIINYYKKKNIINEEQYIKCQGRATKRRKILLKELEELDLPHDQNNEYENYILHEDLDDGKEWVLPKEIKQTVLYTFTNERTLLERLQELFSSNKNMKKKIKESSNLIKSRNIENNAKKRNKIDKDVE